MVMLVPEDCFFTSLFIFNFQDGAYDIPTSHFSPKSHSHRCSVKERETMAAERCMQ